MQISQYLKLESAVKILVSEVEVLKDTCRRQHTFIQDLYELKNTTASKAELHAAVSSLRTRAHISSASTDDTGQQDVQTIEQVRLIACDLRKVKESVARLQEKYSNDSTQVCFRLSTLETENQLDESSTKAALNELSVRVQALELSRETHQRIGLKDLECKTSTSEELTAMNMKMDILEACLKQHVDMFQVLEDKWAIASPVKTFFEGSVPPSPVRGVGSPSYLCPQDQAGSASFFRIGGSFPNLYKVNEEFDSTDPNLSAVPEIPTQHPEAGGPLLNGKDIDRSSVHNEQLNPGQDSVLRCYDSIDANSPVDKASGPIRCALPQANTLVGPTAEIKRPVSSGSCGTYSSRKKKLLNSFSQPRSFTGLKLASSPADTEAFNMSSWGHRRCESILQGLEDRQPRFDPTDLCVTSFKLLSKVS